MSILDFDAPKHGCTKPGCTFADSPVCYDDEPYCFEHSPDEGSSVIGYSHQATLKAKENHPTHSSEEAT